jgi:hypothetical protein
MTASFMGSASGKIERKNAR